MKSWNTLGLMTKLKALGAQLMGSEVWSLEEQDFYQDLVLYGHTPDQASGIINLGRVRKHTITELAAKRKALRAAADAKAVDNLVTQMNDAPKNQSGHTHADPRIMTEGCELCRIRKWREYHVLHQDHTVHFDKTCQVCHGKLHDTDEPPENEVKRLEARRLASGYLDKKGKRRLAKLRKLVKKKQRKAERIARAEGKMNDCSESPPVEPLETVVTMVQPAVDLEPRVTDDEVHAALLIMQTAENPRFADKAADRVRAWLADRLRIMAQLHLPPVPVVKTETSVNPLLALLPPARTTKASSIGFTAPGAVDTREAGHPESCVCVGCEWFHREMAEADGKGMSQIRRILLRRKLNDVRAGRALWNGGGLVYLQDESAIFANADEPFNFRCEDQVPHHQWVATLSDKVVCSICGHKPHMWSAKPVK